MIQCKLRSEAIETAERLSDVLNRNTKNYYRTQICDYAFEVRIIDIENRISVIITYIFIDNDIT